MKINIIQAHNYPGSITRATAMISNSLVKMNHNVVISYPIVPQYSHFRYRLTSDPYFLKTFFFPTKEFFNK